MNTSLMHPAALQHMGENKPEEMCILRFDYDDREFNGDFDDDAMDHSINLIFMMIIRMVMMMMLVMLLLLSLLLLRMIINIIHITIIWIMIFISRKPIFNNTEIPVPHCAETYPAQPLVGEVCNANEVSMMMVMIVMILVCAMFQIFIVFPAKYKDVAM